MGTLNAILNVVFDLMIMPLRGLHPLLGLLLVSLVMAVLALLAFRVASNAAAITRIKTRIGAYLLEMRLFRDDLRVLLIDPWRIFALNTRYVAHAFVPFLLILPIMLLAMVHIESRYAWRALEPGESTIVTARVAPEVEVMTAVLSIETSPGIAVETAAVRIPSRREISWRLRALAPGQHWVQLTTADGATIQKAIWVDGQPGALAHARTARLAGLAAIAEPAEAPLPMGGIVRELRIPYPEAERRTLGLSTSVWIFFGLSTLFGFALKNVVGVTI